VGIANAVAVENVALEKRARENQGPVNTNTSDVVLLDIDDPAMVREVGVYWYDVLLTTEVGRTLHETVLKSPLPPGAVGVRDER
jgi:hypothetical protein